jgi:hypothetical protein
LSLDAPDNVKPRRYAIVAWLLTQAASILFPTFEAPPWVMKVFVTAGSGKMGNWGRV